jgi:hypothetical protein
MTAPKPRKIFKIPEDQIVARWDCHVCNKSGLFTFPSKDSVVRIVDIAMGIHRTLSLTCKMHDVTLTRTEDKILTVRFQNDKSVAPGETKKFKSQMKALN